METKRNKYWIDFIRLLIHVTANRSTSNLRPCIFGSLSLRFHPFRETSEGGELLDIDNRLRYETNGAQRFVIRLGASESLQPFRWSCATREPLSIFSLKLGERFPESPFCLLRLTRSSLVIPRISFAQFLAASSSSSSSLLLISPPIFSVLLVVDGVAYRSRSPFLDSWISSIPWIEGTARFFYRFLSIELNVLTFFFLVIIAIILEFFFFFFFLVIIAIIF